ncbi:MAG: hypothetical protein CMH11_07905 [Maritimibacter sp.]|nr:hypothetical protein [Maritimibacter sp.]|tara:strand:- start:73950 stop:75974 length:2025 start_codon:yes stop_codon:yes gene_type:complete
MRILLFRILLALTMGLPVAGPSFAQVDDLTHRLHFGGWSGVVKEGTIKGRRTITYDVSAERGQTLTVRLYSDNSATYFNVYAPGDGPGDAVLANSSLVSNMVPDVNEFTAELPETGTYRVSVYLFRAAARAGEPSNFSVEFDLVEPSVASNPSADYAMFQVRTRSTGGHLNVHSGPSEDSPRVGRFPNGSLLRNIGGCSANEGRDWCEVMADGGGLVGFVARSFLAGVTEHHDPGVTQPQASFSSMAANPTVRRTINAASEFFHVHLAHPDAHLNIHASPSAASPLIGRLMDGTDLRNMGGCVESEGRAWCDVMMAGGGTSGWVAAAYLRDGQSPATHVVPPTMQRTAQQAPAATAPTAASDYWRVALNRSGSSLRVHTNPSTSAPIVGRFHDRAVLKNVGGCLVHQGREWCNVSSVSGAVSGWVSTDFIEPTSEPGMATIDTPAAIPTASGPSYDGTGEIQCTADRDAPDATCTYGVVQEGTGNGYLQITSPGYGMRSISFEHGRPAYFDKSQADGDIQMRANLDGDNWIVFIGDARFVIPSALFSTGDQTGMATQLPLAPGEAPVAESEDAMVPGTDFNATSMIPCVRDRDAADASCEAGVVREGNGNGYVQVTWPDGGERVIFFENGTPVSYDQSQADGDAEMTVTRDGDTFVVFVGEARFSVPEALLIGG